MVGGEHGVVRGINHTLAQRRVDLGPWQVYGGCASGGKDRLHQPFRCAHLQPLEILDAIKRFFRHKRLHAGTATADKFHAIGLVELVHQLITATMVDVVNELVRAGPGANGVADQAECRILSREIPGHGNMAIQHAHFHGAEGFGVADNAAHRQQVNLDTTTGHRFYPVGPRLLDLEVLDAGRI